MLGTSIYIVGLLYPDIKAKINVQCISVLGRAVEKECLEVVVGYIEIDSLLVDKSRLLRYTNFGGIFLASSKAKESIAVLSLGIILTTFSALEIRLVRNLRCPAMSLYLGRDPGGRDPSCENPCVVISRS